MQEQAAPPRFRGVYPHIISIDKRFLPRDRFLWGDIKQQLNNGVLVDAGNCITGHFPKLALKLKDPELQRLAGPGLVDFDDIDCKDITCTCINKPRFLQLFSYTEPDRDAIVYNDCKRTIFAAAKRQMKSAPTPDLDVLHEFLDFAKAKINELIGDDLAEFGYSFNQWYNHLTHSKQLDMDEVHEFIHGNDPLKEHYQGVEFLNPKLLHYEAICKVEVQGTDGKPRMVCSIPKLIKYVMGPVCWKLEELFAEKIPTYCGGQNLQQMQDKINHYIDMGYRVVAEGDGSAFDNTQDVLLKEIDRFIYNLIADRVYHVPRELFEHVANAYYKVMDVVQVEGKKKHNIMTYAILGTVFSGDCDTTLMNTLRMGLYNWFTCYKAGLNLGEEFVCFSKGDDFTVMFKDTVDTDYVKSYYNKYWLSKPKPNGPSYDGCDERVAGIGQILKFIEFGPPNTIKFCSLRAWYTSYDGQHIYLTRDPGKFTTLSKYSRKALHLRDVKLAEYCYDQALALKVSSGGIHYFDEMAKMYYKVGDYYNHETQDKGCHNRTCKDKRITLPLEVSEEYDGYSRSPRKVAIRIEGNYWETMKRLTTVNTTKLTPEQLRIVNEQIDAEFADRPIFLLDAGRP